MPVMTLKSYQKTNDRQYQDIQDDPEKKLQKGPDCGRKRILLQVGKRKRGTEVSSDLVMLSESQSVSL